MVREGAARVLLRVGALFAGLALFAPLIASCHLAWSPWSHWRLANRPPDAPFRYHVTDKVVALTLDDGPDPAITPQVLELLETRGHRATFFVVGSALETNTAVADSIRASGMEIAPHCYEHRTYDSVPHEAAKHDLRRAVSVVSSVTGQPARWFRSPKGALTPESARHVRAAGLSPVLWSVPLERHRHRGRPESAAHSVVKRVRPGDIILAHDGRLDRSETVAALEVVLERLHERGYRVVTVSELAALGRPRYPDDPRAWLELMMLLVMHRVDA